MDVDDELYAEIDGQRVRVVLSDGAMTIPLNIPVKCVERSDVKISVVSEANANSRCSGEFRGWLKANGSH